MSDTDKPEIEDSQSEALPVLEDKSLEKLPRNSESQPIVINFFSSSCAQKTDKLIQTERELDAAFSEKKPGEEVKVEEVESLTEKKKLCIDASEKPPEKTDSKLTQIIIKKLGRSMSEERKEERQMMDCRKMMSDGKPARNNPPTKQASDLERRRLQAELKAAEEIARIKQTLIEKRLALELATIEDSTDFLPKMAPPRPSPQAELRALEEMALRKQSLIETNLAQELESLDYQSRIMQAPVRQPPPPPPRQPPPPPPKLNPFRTESSSSVYNPLRGLGMQKMNLDKKFSGDSGQRSPNPLGYLLINEQKYPETRREERYATYGPRPESGYNPAPRPEPNRARLTWKSAVAKIRKKIRSKPSQNWNED